VSWLQRVQQLYRQGGFTERGLGERAGISHTYVNNILAGRSIPSLEMLYMLLDALTDSSSVKQAILGQFTKENPGYKHYTTQRERPDPPSKNDIRKLTEAITELNGLLREFLQEQRRYPE
jgi:transcriptional regulator with XRE-family HTH domain